MQGLILLLIAGAMIFWLACLLGTAWMLTHPPRRTYAWALARTRPGTPAELPSPRPFSAWSFRTAGLELPAWDVAGDNPAGPTIILTHGWGDSRVGALARVHALAPHARRLILWDLPGHGDAAGLCRLGATEAAHLADLLEALATGPFVLFGWSLGAGLSLRVAAERPAGIIAVIAEAPYCMPRTPARNVLAARALPWRLTLDPAIAAISILLTRRGLGRAFDRAAWAARVAAPILIIHGENDIISPPADGLAIADAAPSGTFAPIPDAGHNDLWTNPAHADACTRAIDAFLSTLPS